MLKTTFLPICCLLSSPVPGMAAELMIAGIDSKVELRLEGVTKVKPKGDLVILWDIADPLRPRQTAKIALGNSIFGPPTNLLITPDGSRALVANSVNWVQTGNGWDAEPDSRIHVLELEDGKPRQISSVSVDAQPSGMGISADGKTVVVANRKGQSVSLLRIGNKIENTHTVSIEGEAAAVAVSPDGQRALVTKFAEHAVAVVGIEGNNLTYDPDQDIAVGRWPYNVQITPNGKLALVANNGKNGFPDGHADTVSVVDLEASPPRTIDHVTVGDAPEGLAISPDGTLAVAPLLQGSAPPFANKWFFNRKGAIAVLRIEGKKVTLVDTVETGRFPEGVGFSRDGRHLFVGDLADSQVTIFKVEGAKLTRAVAIDLPGYPASLRTQVP